MALMKLAILLCSAYHSPCSASKRSLSPYFSSACHVST